MTAPTFRDILQTGGGNIQYVFHVSGYPWAVCTSDACARALNDAGNAVSRRTIFGVEQYDGNYFADDTSLCPIFPVLETPGKQKFQIHEGKGELTGGGWNIIIHDRELGHTWEHGGSTVFRGLPGVHHVLGPDYDSSVGWAYITENLRIEDTDLVVEEQSGGILKTAIDAAESTFPYRLLWLNQECLCAKGTTGTGNAYTIDISDDTTYLGRGLFRSKHQDHFTEYYSDADPIVTDTPFSIIDKPCWLWAVVLNEAGTDILVNPVIVRSGQVSPNIKTQEGMTRIGVLSPFKQLDNDVRVPGFSEHLDRYIFTRQAWTYGTDFTALATKRQGPHLVIHEFDTDMATTIHEIWICARSTTATTTREFDTAADVLAALETELKYCSEGSTQQYSGEGGSDLVTLGYNYALEEGYLKQTEKSGGETLFYRSLISGPLAFLFNLGPVYNRINDLVGNGNGFSANCPWFFSNKYVISYPAETRASLRYPYMVCMGDASEEDSTDISSDIRLVPRENWITPFLYMQPYELGDFEDIYSYDQWTERFTTAFDLPTNYLYFKKDADLDNIAVGEDFALGGTGDWMPRPRRLKGTVATTGTSNGYPYVTITHDLYPIDGNAPTCCYYGVGLYFIPALEDDISERADGEDAYTYLGPTQAVERWNNPEAPFPMEGDPWVVSQLFQAESKMFSDPFRAVLGDDGANYSLADNLVLSDIIGFSTESTDDVGSFIDWDALDEFSGFVLPDKQSYLCNVGTKFNLAKLLAAELVFHGLMPTWEWDNTLNHHVMRFRELGPISVTAANNEGRVLNENMILRNSRSIESHNDTWMYNKFRARCNYKDGGYNGTFAVDFLSGNARNRTAARELKADAKLSQIQRITQLADADISYITKKYTTLLRHLATPNVQYTVKTDLSALVDIAIGRECLVTDSTGFYPFSHERGLVEAPALVTGMSIDFNKAECEITARLTKNRTRGWAPAARVTASTKDGSGVITCTTTANYFSESGERTDNSYFDCYTYNKSTGIYTAKDCSCSDYKIIAFERNIDGASWEPTLLYFNVTSVNTSTGTSMTLYDATNPTDTYYDLWDTTAEYILIFSTYDLCESCQQNYVFFADDDNFIGAADDLGNRWT